MLSLAAGRITSLLVVGICCGVTDAESQTDLASLNNVEVIAKAKEAFRNGKELLGRPKEARSAFGEAARLCEELRRRGVSGADHYLRQGNAEYLSGNLAKAPLSYRRGLRIAPGDRKLQENLDALRDQVAYPDTQISRPPELLWPSWLPYPSSDFVFVVVFLFYAYACANLASWCLRADRSSLLRGMLGAVVASLLLLAWAGMIRQDQLDDQSAIVVVAKDNAGFYRGNGRSYPRHDKMPVLHAGMEAHLRHRRGGWLQIEFVGGAVGWVQLRDVYLEK